MSITVAHLAQVLQTLMTSTAQCLGRATGFVQRESKMSAAIFLQALVFTWLANPRASRHELSQTAAAVGVSITAQGIDDRMNEAAVVFLRAMVEEAVSQVWYSQTEVPTILQRFKGVHVADSTVIDLPAALTAQWPACGQGRAALKLPTELELNRGTLRVSLEAGRVHDQRTGVQRTDLPPGSLRLADLGFFDLAVLASLDQGGVYWLSRLKMGTVLLTSEGERWDPVEVLGATRETRWDQPVQLGASQRLACRLVGERVPPPVAEERRRKTRQDARRRGQTPSAARLALADWTLYLTNAPTHLLSAAEALVIATARWQIELLFKLWKSQGHLDESRSTHPHKILCEVYAKLIAVLIQHWVCLVSLWAYPDRSLVKAAQTIRKHALALVCQLPARGLLIRSLDTLARCLIGCRINKSRQHPATFQRLLALA